MHQGFENHLTERLDRARRERTWKTFRPLEGPQGPRARVEGLGEVLVLSSNNYLGLASEPEIVEAAREGLDRFGFGTSSVRFICGTFTVHRELERALARFVGTEAALTYVSAWNANGALFPTLLDEKDVVISDALNHASIIDGIRASKAQRKVYAHGSLDELARALESSRDARTRMIMTDGVFSMDGDVAPLAGILQLAREHDAIVAVDDSHGTGVLGATGRGAAEACGVLGEIDIVVSTLGKALGGAAGGFVAASGQVVETLAQLSRPLTFSNALPPVVASGALAAVRFVEAHPERVADLRENARFFRARLEELGLSVMKGETPIVPIILGDAGKAVRMSELLLEEGIFVTAFAYPVVPPEHSRIRCQVSAAHSRADLAFAAGAIGRAARKLDLL